ncbi:MAG TPA: ATP-grasp domain-containing protein [Candidatus Caccalectryoclostridium excrementigallinarum]|uniref:ATP-grasp domain-containing protein n=1 Tax=Candidatus Caccalectryoclostridium excrementigallinarum TaxID=2840710 RepID=A0A9D1MNA1_9FIRM|nr:ATP-grasp domain-containing protein [Candidatus Caccalectryoclostridium excrementigallinarum]
MINILILSAGTRNKVVRYFKKTLAGQGKVVATDCQNIAPAIYDADKCYIVPRITSPDYIDIIAGICQKEHINGILSLIDPELELLAENREKFEKIGVTCIVSPLEAVKMAFDKMKMFRFCESNGIDSVKSYDDIDRFKADLAKGKIAFPVFVKPICGSCSINIQRVEDMAMLEELWRRYDNLMIQEFMTGQEIGADVYIDPLSGEVIEIFTKKKLLMRAGETDKSVSFKEAKLFEFIENFVTKAGYKWNIDIDIFEKDGKYFVSEVNPRFGGGYPHAYECGCDFMQLIKNNLEGKKNKPNIGDYDDDVYMMKYLDVMIKRGEELR